MNRSSLSSSRASLVLAVAFAWGGASACNDAASAQPDGVTTTARPASRNATRVETAVITPSQAALTVTLPGEVEAWRDAELAAPMGGFVESVRVKSGDEVKKGQVLATIDSASHVARRNQTKVELDAAKIEVDRAKKLGKTLPGAQLDAAKARHEAAKAAYAAADVAVSRSVITAPFAGVAVSVDIEQGEVAAPGVPLIRVVRLDPVKVTVSLSDRDVLSVKKGMKAQVSTDARGNLRDGVVKHIQPAADLRTRAFVGEIEVANTDGALLPGMIASVRLAADVAESKIVISQDWLVTKPESLGVFVLKDGQAGDGATAEWREVKIGPIVRNSCVVDSGLRAGDVLITSGHRELAAGDALIVARKGTCCTEGRVVFDDGSPPAKSPGANQPASTKE